MNKTIKAIPAIVALALGLNAGVANATTANFGTLGSTEQHKVFTHVLDTDPTFNDRINFTLAGTSVLNGSATNFIFSLDGADIFNVGGLTGTLFGGAHSGASKDSISFGSFGADGLTHSFNLLAGIYHIDLTGTITGSDAGQYAVALRAAPVPEPESYAMLLAGLGLMGTIARRRSKSKGV